jgi:hypothetical protein
MENKKILYVIGSLQVGGTEKQVIGLANENLGRFDLLLGSHMGFNQAGIVQ